MATVTKRNGKKGVSYYIRAFGGVGPDGKRVEYTMTWRPGPGLTAKQADREAQKRALEFEEECEDKIPDSSMTFQDFAKRWFDDYAIPNLRPRTIDRYRQMEKRVYEAIGDVRLDKMTAPVIQKFINDLREKESGRWDSAVSSTLRQRLEETEMSQKTLAITTGLGESTISSACKGKSISVKSAMLIADALGAKMDELFDVSYETEKLSPKTVKNYHGFVSAVLAHAVRMGLVKQNMARNVLLPKNTQTEKTCYTVEETQKFLDSLTDAPIKYKSFFVLAIYGGFRREELLGLEWKDIDFNTNIISIRRSSLYTKEKGIFTDTTKTSKSKRTVKLPSEVFNTLKRHRAEQSRMRLALGQDWVDTDRLYTDDFGRPMHPNTPYSWLRRFCDRTGQKFYGIHQFRHLNATLLITNGVDARTVSGMLGHSQVSTTLNIYAHTFDEAKARAGEVVAGVLSSKIGSRVKEA